MIIDLTKDQREALRLRFKPIYGGLVHCERYLETIERIYLGHGTSDETMALIEITYQIGYDRAKEEK